MIFNLTKTEKDKAQITIYGPIKDISSFFSGGGASPDKIMRDLDELSNAKEFSVRLNSGGGSAFAGFAIFELIRAHGAKVTTYIDGVAASAASIIAMAGDRIVMGTGAMMMIHNPWTRVEGEAKDLRAAADVLDRVGESLINIYSARTKKSREELREMLNKTTWMTAEEAVEFGFADEVDKKFEVSASIQGDSAVFNDQRFELSYFAEVPQLPILSTTPEPVIQEPSNTQTPATQDEGNDTVKDLAELQAKHPDIYQAAVQAGAQQERDRMKGIDEIANNISEDLVASAKYEQPINAAELALAAIKADAGKGMEHIKNRQQELQQNTTVNSQTPPDADAKNKQEEAAAINEMVSAMNAGRGMEVK